MVEDQAILAITHKALLEKAQFCIDVVLSGEAAVANIHEDTQYDLVLMDIHLGDGIDGTEAARRIIALHDIPILFLSSHTEIEYVEKTEAITS